MNPIPSTTLPVDSTSSSCKTMDDSTSFTASLITCGSHIKPTKLPENFKPRENDILCGRGRGTWDHTGNRRFKRFVENHAEKYQLARTKFEKGVVVASLVDAIRKAGILFVKQDKKTKRWHEIGEFHAREKTGHAVRDHISRMGHYRSFEKLKHETEKMRTDRLHQSVAFDKSAEEGTQQQNVTTTNTTLQSARTDPKLSKTEVSTSKDTIDRHNSEPRRPPNEQRSFLPSLSSFNNHPVMDEVFEDSITSHQIHSNSVLQSSQDNLFQQLNLKDFLSFNDGDQFAEKVDSCKNGRWNPFPTNLSSILTSNNEFRTDKYAAVRSDKELRNGVQHGVIKQGDALLGTIKSKESELSSIHINPLNTEDDNLRWSELFPVASIDLVGTPY